MIDLASQAFAPVRPGIEGATIDTEQLTVTTYRYESGSTWEQHAHDEDQVTLVVSGGTICFTVGDDDVRLEPGQAAVIPGGVPHSARVLDTEVVTLNVWRRRGSVSART